MSHSPAGSLEYCPTHKTSRESASPLHAARLPPVGLDAAPRKPASGRPVTTSLPHSGFTPRVQPTHKTSPFRDSHVAVKNAQVREKPETLTLRNKWHRIIVLPTWQFQTEPSQVMSGPLVGGHLGRIDCGNQR